MQTEKTKLEVIEEEQIQGKKLNLEDSLRKYFSNKDIVKQINEENKLLKEAIEQDFEQMGGTEFIVELSNEQGFAKVFKKPSIKEKLDVEALANHLQISKDELKTPWDFSKLSEKYLQEVEKNERTEKLSRLITLYTDTENQIKTKISKVKKKPKNKK